MSLLIAVDLRPLIEPFESGVTVFTKAMVRQFQRAKGKGAKGVELLLFYQSRHRCERIHKLFPDVRHVKISTTAHRVRSLFGFPELPDGYFCDSGEVRQSANRRQPDLIFMPDRRPFYRTKIPVVLTVHDLVPEKFARTLSWKGRIWFKVFSLKRLLRISSGVLVPTLSIANELAVYMPKKMRRAVKREAIYEGAELAAKMAVPSRAKQLTKKPFFFMLSPADPRKRADWVLDMARRFPRVNFAIVGVKEGDKRFSCMRARTCLKKRKRPKNLFIFGQVSEQEKLWFFKNAHALLALSQYEGFDLPVLEAVTAKCPVIMSDISVHQELYKDATFVRDQNALQVAIYNSLQGRGSRSVPRHAPRKLRVPKPRGQYTWEAASKRALFFFRRVVSDKNR